MSTIGSLVDTHCHIHSEDYALNSEHVYVESIKSGVNKLICVGCTPQDSILAIRFAENHSGVWASVGIHPHEADRYYSDIKVLQNLAKATKSPKVAAVGEIGLDYHYKHSLPTNQKKLLRHQIGIAQAKKLPIIFHVREAFDDFWPIFDSYSGLKGVIHSFTSTQKQLQNALDRGLYVSINGIVTFMKSTEQLETIKNIPANRLLLETDAPYLTPTPYRGNICAPEHLVKTAEFLSNLRGETYDEIASYTSQNAHDLFSI